jgi:hypothetical protein
VRVGYAFGGLAGFQSCLQSPFCYFPHDAVVPQALRAGDLPDLAAALAPRALRLAGLVDGLNRRVSAKSAAQVFEQASAAYRATDATGEFMIDAADHQPADSADAAAWMLRHLITP